MGALVGFCCVDLSDVMGQQKGGVEALADVDSRIGVSCDIWWANRDFARAIFLSSHGGMGRLDGRWYRCASRCGSMVDKSEMVCAKSGSIE